MNTNIAPVNMGNNDTYVIEVVARPRENLALGKYLVAESEKKDAADILIIMVSK